ncbi:MAG TPA: phosphoenolpyruvate--protein phosphotransferase [Paracoccaceae bacterium]|nr:phosphoenolpyruvate--protein phosphotransferase [Paracoccaceae bacterium]
MPNRRGVESQVLLKRLRDTLAEPGAGQERLDKIVKVIASSMEAEVCSIYLRRDDRTLELCATEGLKKEAVHQTRLTVGQGLVGRIADSAEPVSAENAPQTRGFRYMPETGEEIYSSFLGVPIQRLGEVLGVLVVQNLAPRIYRDDEVYALEIVAMVIAEMTELGAFSADGEGAMAAPHKLPFLVQGLVGQEGVAEGHVLLHQPNILIANPIADDPAVEKKRLAKAFSILQEEVEQMLDAEHLPTSGEHREVLEAFRLFAQDRGWRRRMEESIESGLAAEVAVEKEQSNTRTRMERVADTYLRERLHDLDDLSNRLLRILAGQDQTNGREIPEDAILVARNIGPGELLDYGRQLKGVVLEEGSVGSHAAIVARALAIPLVIQASRITREAQNGDHIMVDGDQGLAHLRPDDNVAHAFREKLAMRSAAQQEYTALRDLPAETLDHVKVRLEMNAGLMADLPSLRKSGAEGVGLYRTELQFLLRSTVPRRNEQADLYSRVLDAAGDKPVTFRTLDIGSDKVLPYMKKQDEPNPALGWRAIRVGLDRPGVMRMQLQTLLRGAKGRPLKIMFPMVAQFDEFREARRRLLEEIERERERRHLVPDSVQIGAMLETPSLAFAPDQFFQMADFISIGGNDLKQFFFAADRENERVRRRYDTLNVSFLTFIEQIAERCYSFGTPVSFCGEDAGRPLEALALTAMGLRILSMRPASIGPVKRLLRSVHLAEVRDVMDSVRISGTQSVRKELTAYLDSINAPYK